MNNEGASPTDTRQLDKRVGKLEARGYKNSIAFSTLENEAEILKLRIKELEDRLEHLEKHVWNYQGMRK